MKYDVLTLDTQVFTTNSFDFDGGWLAQVKQFKNGPISVVVSSVVAREVRNQLAEKIRQSKDRFEAATKDAVFYGLDAKAAEVMPLLPVTPRALAAKRIRAYLEAVGASIVPANLITVEELMDAYFKPAPPFAASGKKKAEFPDAVALLSLESWARTEGKQILAASGDSDWAGFADKSHCIDVAPTLEDALTRLQAHEEEARSLVESFLAAVDTPDSNEAVAFRGLLEPDVDSQSVLPEVEVSQQAEVDGGELSLIDFRLAGEAPEFDFRIVRFGPWEVAASIELSLKVNATAHVSFYSWDSIDRESIPMGSTVAEREVEDLHATAIATWTKDPFDQTWEISSVEVVSVDNPDVGYVEMDWGEDSWEE